MPHTRSARLASVLAPVLIAALTGGCGQAEHVGSDRTLAVALTEYRLNPKTATVGSGTLTIVVHNYGRLSHNLVLARDGQTAGSTRAIPPGQTAEIVLSVTRGSYTMSSTILSDTALGESGTLKVN
jgi:plastocyanin